MSGESGSLPRQSYPADECARCGVVVPKGVKLDRDQQKCAVHPELSLRDFHDWRPVALVVRGG